MAKSFNQPFVPGPRLIDGSDLNSAFGQPVLSTEDDAVATGTTVADAYPLLAAVTRFGTVAASTGAKLKNLPAGGVQVVYNAGASTLTVYDASGSTIDGTAGATGVSLSAASRAQFTRLAGGDWVSALLGAVSS